MANALRTVDVYTAKLAGRSGRDSLPPPRAARDLLVVERGNPFALALITEFGVHPPGSLVRLYSGEVAVVVRRTADSNAPQVAVLAGRRGEPLAEPLLLEASGRDRGIAGPAEAKGLRGAHQPRAPVRAGAGLDVRAGSAPAPRARARQQPQHARHAARQRERAAQPQRGLRRVHLAAQVEAQRHQAGAHRLAQQPRRRHDAARAAAAPRRHAAHQAP